MLLSLFVCLHDLQPAPCISYADHVQCYIRLHLSQITRKHMDGWHAAYRDVSIIAMTTQCEHRSEITHVWCCDAGMQCSGIGCCPLCKGMPTTRECRHLCSASA